MSEHGITGETLMAAFPQALRRDPPAETLGGVAAEALAKRPAEIALLALYPRIDGLPEDLLDILARDFKVDWWDVNYSLEEKRRTLKDSWRVHRILGTKAAVETAISAIYPDTKVLEWFEYGGEPYHFKLLVNAAYERIDPEKHRRVLERVACYKNLRSHMDEVEYCDSGEAAAFAGAVCTGSGTVDGAWALKF